MDHSRSIIVENEHWSAISGDEVECRHHLIFGQGRRELAEEDGLWIPLTHDEHNMGELLKRIHDNCMAEDLSKIAGQLAWEGDYYRKAAGMGLFSARRAFRTRYGQSYL
jgi:hypothetical protein